MHDLQKADNRMFTRVVEANNALSLASALPYVQVGVLGLHRLLQASQSFDRTTATLQSAIAAVAHNRSILFSRRASSRTRRQRKAAAVAQHTSGDAHLPKQYKNSSTPGGAPRPWLSCKAPSTTTTIASSSSSASMAASNSHIRLPNATPGAAVMGSTESSGRLVVPEQHELQPAAAGEQGGRSLQEVRGSVCDDSGDHSVLDYFASDNRSQEQQLLLPAAALAKLSAGNPLQGRYNTESDKSSSSAAADAVRDGHCRARPWAAAQKAVAVRDVSWLKPSLGDRLVQQGTAVRQREPAVGEAARRPSDTAVDGQLNTQQAVKIIELAQRKALKNQMPMEALGTAIAKALELAKLHPHLDASDLLHPAIVSMQLSFADERATRLKRLLPDTKLKAELIAKDPQAVSDKITCVITAFSSHLGMQPPPQLLSHAWTFVKALRIPDQQLAAHLQGLVHLAGGSRKRARGLAQLYSGALLSSSWLQMMPRVEQLRDVLQLPQEHALEFALRYPYLLRTKKQLQHVYDIVEQAPTALGQSLDLLLPSFQAHPQLFQYDSCDALVQKYQELATVLGGAASPPDLLALCAAASVRRASVPGAVAESIRTSSSITGFSRPAELLPLLVRPAAQQQQQGLEAGAAAAFAGTANPAADAAKPPTAPGLQCSAGSSAISERTKDAVIFLQPADRLQERAAVMRHLWGLSAADVARVVRYTPQALSRDPKTQQLKLMLLQRQLLGQEPQLQDKMLAPEMTKMLKKCPWLPGLEVETCLNRLAALETALQLQHTTTRQLALRVPSLLLLQPELLQQAVAALQQGTGGLQQARKLVLEDPKVLLYLNRARYGAFQAQLSALQVLLDEAKSSSNSSSSIKQHCSSWQPQQAADSRSLTTAAASAQGTTAAAAAAADAVAAAAARASQLHFAKIGTSGVKAAAGGTIWIQKHIRMNGKRVYCCSQHTDKLHAAVAYDLLRLAELGAGAAVNLPDTVYLPEHVGAVAAYVDEKHDTSQAQWRQQQQEQFAAAQYDIIMRAAVARAAARAVSSGAASSHGFTGIRIKGDGRRWEMRSSLVYTRPDAYSSYHDTATEAAVAYDLVRLALKGPGTAVNNPEEVYGMMEVEDMARYLQHKQQQFYQQQQQQQAQETDAQHDAVQSVYAQSQVLPVQQQQQQQPHWQLLLQCLKTKTGRQLLGMQPETGRERLQFLADLLGANQQQLLLQALANDSYLYGVLALSKFRMEETAVQLQQQLELSTVQLQQLLRAVPRLLLYRSATLEKKVAVLLQAFRRTHAAVAAIAGGAVDADAQQRKHQHQQQHWAAGLQQAFTGAAGFAALQLAVLRSPWILCLDAEKVAWKLSVLQECCSCGSDLAVQVADALEQGTIGRWLLAGEARYTKLHQLICGVSDKQQDYGQQQQQSSTSSSPLSQKLTLSWFMRVAEDHLGGVYG